MVSPPESTLDTSFVEDESQCTLTTSESQLDTTTNNGETNNGETSSSLPVEGTCNEDETANLCRNSKRKEEKN
ncbi:hypothetical protein AVEN_210769-1 [Araneus ventricosus]|uniref:Uncharacterized protein n=1 Tax=Araneus ventricosus TaxID=182803 RepID=A0A4Y2PQ07_ARAVE|nr:hypothetical protein AVEN_210769-1 [Araneus ventricosus]